MVPIKVERRLVVWRLGGRLGIRLGIAGRGGLGFRGGDGTCWLIDHRLVLLFAAPLRDVDIWFDGRGRGLGRRWGKGGGPE